MESNFLVPTDTDDIWHGVNCDKVLHGNDAGHLHGENDDSPYFVDGCKYCGRCHESLPNK